MTEGSKCPRLRAWVHGYDDGRSDVPFETPPAEIDATVVPCWQAGWYAHRIMGLTAHGRVKAATEWYLRAASMWCSLGAAAAARGDPIDACPLPEWTGAAAWWRTAWRHAARGLR